MDWVTNPVQRWEENLLLTNNKPDLMKTKNGDSVAAKSIPKLIPSSFGRDGLSEFIKDSHDNLFATFVKNKNNRYSDLLEIHECFSKISENLINTKDPFPALLLLRSFSSYRAACITAMSGQVVETFPLLRSCLEFAGYALLMKSDEKLIEVWMNRHSGENDEEKIRSKNATRGKFKTENIKKLISEKDKKLGRIFIDLYERTIDSGGHPNERAVTGSFRVIESEGVKKFEQIFLHGDDINTEFAMKSVAEVGLCSLDIFQNIFPERYLIIGLGDKLNEIKKRF